MAAKNISDPFKALFNNATAGIVVVDQDGMIVMVNKFASTIFGYKTSELQGQKLDILIPSEYKQIHKKHHKKYYKKPESRQMGKGLNLFGLHKKGRKIPLEISLGFYTSNAKKYVIAIINDITEKKAKEKELLLLNETLDKKVNSRTLELKRSVKQLNDQIERIQKQDKDLKETNIFLKTLLKNAGTTVIATDPKGIIKIFNPTAEKLLGYKAKEVINKHTPAIFHDAAETKERAKQFSKELGEKIKPGFNTYIAKARRNIVEPVEWTHIRKDKTRFPVLLTISALYNDSGEITGYLGIAIDISERKKLLTDLQAALEKEKRLGELKSRFVSVASHEFRTPLSTILSSVYLLSKYKTTEEQQKREKHIQRIDSSIQYLNNILNDFLSIGKIEEEKIKLNPVELDMTTEIKNTLAELNHMLKQGQHFKYTHSGSKKVMLDAVLFKHILLNLLSNAIKFSPENKGIDIQTKINSHTITLVIKDRGIGVPEEDKLFLFKRFYRASNVENIGGTGLGLYIVEKYCEMLDGTISFTSEVNKGTTFILTFPKKEL